jgi:hypothetical protein
VEECGEAGNAGNNSNMYDIFGSLLLHTSLIFLDGSRRQAASQMFWSLAVKLGRSDHTGSIAPCAMDPSKVPFEEVLVATGTGAMSM